MKRLFYQHGALIIGLTPVVVYCLSCLLFEANDDSVVKIKELLLANVSKTMPTAAMRILEYKARVLWQCSSLLSLCAYTAAMVWSCSILYRCCQSGAQSKTILSMGMAIVCLTLLQIVLADTDSALYIAIYSTTYDALGVSPLIADEFHRQVFWVINLINLLSAMAPVFILVAICATFSIADHRADPDIHFIAERLDYLKQGVAAGSIVLLFGIIHMVAWLQWPNALLGENSTFAKVFTSYSHANSQFWGLTFTLLLLSIYIAATVALQTRVEDALDSMPDSAAKQRWLMTNNVTMTFQKHAIQLGMMLMPTLAGSMNSFFEIL